MEESETISSLRDKLLEITAERDALRKQLVALGGAYREDLSERVVD